MDKIADALTGHTRPEIWTDEDGNEFVYHQDIGRGRQWMKIAGTAAKGAAAGLAAGKGAGNMGKGALAGIQAGEDEAKGERDREEELSQKAQQDMLNRYNMTMVRMRVADMAWQSARRDLVAGQEDAKFYQEQIKFYHDVLGAESIGTAEHAYDLGNVLKIDPQLAEHFMRDHTIVPLPISDGHGHQGVEFMQMKNGDWQKEPVKPGTTYNFFNKATHIMEQHQAADGTTAGQIAMWNGQAYADEKEYKLDQLNIQEKEEAIKNVKGEREAREKELPSKIAKNWADARKANMEAQKAKDEEDLGHGDIAAEAQALVDKRTAPSLFKGSRKDFLATMKLANQFSMEQLGVPFDQQDAEMEYKGREKLRVSFMEGEHAGTIETFDRFLGHSVEASEAINALRNGGSRLMNTAINTIESDIIPSKRAPELQSALVAIETVRKEYESALKNNRALTKEDIAIGNKLLDPNLSLNAAQAVLREMAGVASIRLRAEDFTYQRTFHRHAPDLTSEEGNKALRHFGYDPKDVYAADLPHAVPGQHGGAMVGQPTQPGQLPPGAPVGTVSWQNFSDGTVHYYDLNDKQIGVGKIQ